MGEKQRENSLENPGKELKFMFNVKIPPRGIPSLYSE